jgi:hypothetical protein
MLAGKSDGPSVKVQMRDTLQSNKQLGAFYSSTNVMKASQTSPKKGSNTHRIQT